MISGGYVGAAQATLDRGSSTRTADAFGRPIGNFQALAHVMADLQTEIDAARLLALPGGVDARQGAACHREAAMAKLKGSETYVRRPGSGMQVWRATGSSTESVMSFRYRESIVATISGGTSQIQRNTIGDDGTEDVLMGIRSMAARCLRR